MQEIEELLQKRIPQIKNEVPQLAEFFDMMGIVHQYSTQSLGDYIASMSEEHLQDIGVDREQIISNLAGFLERLKELANPESALKIRSLTIIGGHDKSGKPENVELRMEAGTITSIVGPTGAGKSRLLADIEWMAQGDTPTQRRILVNDKVPDTSDRFSLEHKFVAQLSQNMNFVMDATVEEFVQMHAESRMRYDPLLIKKIIDQANDLAGESFTALTPITALSGGQSRALMIADTAFLSSSSVVLVDEIENAGIDRHRAMQLLVNQDKIVLMATHDPILALMAKRRLVIRNGGIHAVIETSAEEQANLTALEEIDNKMTNLRNILRMGGTLNTI